MLVEHLKSQLSGTANLTLNEVVSVICQLSGPSFHRHKGMKDGLYLYGTSFVIHGDVKTGFEVWADGVKRAGPYDTLPVAEAECTLLAIARQFGPGPGIETLVEEGPSQDFGECPTTACPLGWWVTEPGVMRYGDTNYEVSNSGRPGLGRWRAHRRGTRSGPTFRTLEEAKKFVETRVSEDWEAGIT